MRRRDVSWTGLVQGAAAAALLLGATAAGSAPGCPAPAGGSGERQALPAGGLAAVGAPERAGAPTATAVFAAG